MIGTRALRAFAPALLAEIVGIAFSLAAAGIDGAIASAAAAIPLSALMLLSETRHSNKVSERSESCLLASALGSIYNDANLRNLSLGAAISNAMKKIPVQSCAGKAMALLLRSIKSGSDMADALALASVSGSKSVSEALLMLSSEFSRKSDSLHAIKTASDRLSSRIAVENEKSSGAQQRNLTISMAASTVLPSFALFAFVGYSILNYSAAKLALFSALMLVVIPGMYSMIRSNMSG